MLERDGGKIIDGPRKKGNYCLHYHQRKTDGVVLCEELICVVVVFVRELIIVVIVLVHVCASFSIFINNLLIIRIRVRVV